MEVNHCHLVVGPPGSGKTTYCFAMLEILNTLGRRAIIVNLDPGTESTTLEYHIDIREFRRVEQVMKEKDIGPNCAMLHCMKDVADQSDWLRKSLEKFNGYYAIFDCPGQAELYVSCESMCKIITHLSNWNYRICCLNLIDSVYINEPMQFISATLMSLSTMLHLRVFKIKQMELPHLNVLTKLDMLSIIKTETSQMYSAEFYLETLDQKRMIDENKPIGRILKPICDVLDAYSLVTYTVVDVKNTESLLNLLGQIDNCTGYVEDEARSVNFIVNSTSVKRRQKDFEIMQLYMNGSPNEE
ncbi:hypothetical protein ACOME3_000568 [Neoechinorhynchus agilis]